MKCFIVNGVGAAICARHLLYRAQGVVDLPRGERYVIHFFLVLLLKLVARYACMDWAVFSMLGAMAKGLKTLMFSYDICCSWSVNFWERLEKIYGDIYQVPDDRQVTFVIPKFHLEAHGEDCKCAFNLNYTIGAARTCGEGIETGWADTNPAALSTREMSLTYRHEVLDDLFGAINWWKIKTMGAWILRISYSFYDVFQVYNSYENFVKRYLW